MRAGSAVAADGIAPSVVAAAFGGPRTLFVELDERAGSGASTSGAFTVAGPGGSVGVTAAAAAPHSATVALTLSDAAAAGEHTVTAGSAVVDMAGNAVAAGAKEAVASWTAMGGGAPSFAARTSSLTSTVVTFTPAVFGSTAPASWSVAGAPATGIARVGEAEVGDPAAASIALPRGTTSIVLEHAPLHGTAAEPIVAHTGTGIASDGASLGNAARKASDGAGPRLLSASVWRGSDVLARLSEPASFVGESADARKPHWDATAAGFGRVTHRQPEGVSVHPSRTTDLVLVNAAVGSETHLSYGGTASEPGAVTDALGNALARFSGVPLGDLTPPGFRPLYISEAVRVNTNERVAFLPGEIPAFVFEGKDGVRVGMYKSGPSVTVDLFVDPPLILGHEYTVHPPGFADLYGNAYWGGPKTIIFRSSLLESTPPTVESARFAGPREVRVEFSEPLRAVAGGAAFSVTASGGAAIPLAAGGVSHSAGLRTVTLSLASDASPGAHEVRVPATVSDLVGNAYATPGTAIPATYDDGAPTAVSAVFTGERTVTLTVSEALDAETVGNIGVRGLGATSASYTAGSKTVALHTQLPAAAGSSHEVTIPAGVTDARGVAMAPTTLWAARADTSPPVAVGARTTSPTTTEVDFGEAVRLGPSPTPQQHAAHWTVTEGGAERAVTDAEVVRGGLSVRLTHAPVGASAMPSVSYARGTDDGASVRDWAATPNYMASTGDMPVAAGDGLPPRIDSLTVSVSRPGEADAQGRVWARAGDTVRFAMSMSEAAGASAPTIRLAGTAHSMAASGEGRLAWTYDHAVPAEGTSQGALAFVVSASDGGGNAAHAEVPTSGITAMVDTILPSFTARTLGVGLVEVTLTEPVRGTISASEWTVGGAAATGVALSAGAAPGATVALDPGTRLVLWHAGGGTGDEPEVRYGAPDSA